MDEALALLTTGNLQLAVIRMHTMATSFYDGGDDATGDLFAALMVKFAEEQDRRKIALRELELDLDGPETGGLVG